MGRYGLKSITSPFNQMILIPSENFIDTFPCFMLINFIWRLAKCVPFYSRWNYSVRAEPYAYSYGLHSLKKLFLFPMIRVSKFYKFSTNRSHNGSLNIFSWQALLLGHIFIVYVIKCLLFSDLNWLLIYRCCPEVNAS